MGKQLVPFLFLLLLAKTAFSQNCTNIGQTPESAFPVCGTQVFEQNNVPICGTTNIPVPCNDGGPYQNKNPYWYKFTCYTAGTLGFLITPNDLGDDYDWQLFDVTGHNPNDVFTVPSLFVACNWSGETGETGASYAGNGFINCAGPGIPLFSAMPGLVAGHEYLLLVSHFTDSQSGYSIQFQGGTASITDPLEPKLGSARISCDGTQLVVQLNKKMKCSSMASNGSDFTLGGAASIVSETSLSCNFNFDTDTIVLALSNALPPGNYTLTIQNGSDGNTLLDNCGRSIPVGDNVQFNVAPLLPTPMDSIRPFACSPSKLQLVFIRPIRCNSIAANGSDFTVTGPQTVSITSAIDSCKTTGKTILITLQLASPIVVGGNYQVHLNTGSDGNTIIDECGRETPAGSSLSFTAADTVWAGFTYAMRYGCKDDTLNFIHDGRNGVKTWTWSFDNTSISNVQNPVQIYSASSQHTVRLIVSNGVCKDTVTQTIALDNKLIAAFETSNIICPEDAASFKNQSTGIIDSWQWIFGNGNTSNLKTPPSQFYPTPGREVSYTIKLIASSSSLGCKDSVTHSIRVLGNCYIAVPSAFTPNADGLNDYLYPVNALKADNLEFKIYNRWGQLVFESRDWLRKWDGTVNGVPQVTGSYIWFLKFTHHDTGKKVLMKGTTVLIR